MSATTVTVRYDGPILSEHQMDVADLAPALIGLSDLCKIANKKFNGDRAAVKVLINTDTEHQCFQFDIQIIQTIWDQAKGLLTDADVASAKELCEWLGIIGGITGGSVGGTLGFFKLVKWLKGRKIDSAQMEVRDGKDVTRITVVGDNNNVVFAHPQAVELMRDESALNSIKKVVKPVTREGYETLEFEADKDVEKVTKEDAAAIIDLQPSEIEDSLDQPQVMSAWVTVYSPVYDRSAQYWRFRFGESHEYMDISETDIAVKAIERGGALIDDAYYVKLELRQEHKAGGKIANHYKVLEVLDFKQAVVPKQSEIFDDKPEGSPEEGQDR